METANIPLHLLKIQEKCIINHDYNNQENILKNEEEIVFKILNIILIRKGNDFRNYKQSTIRRRIAIRMVVVAKDTLEEYYNFLQINKIEQDILFNELLIPITYFFRDKESFDSLTKTIFPKLIENVTNNALRIWIAGCATGEEVYSLAISLYEYLLQTNNINIKVQIFASDLSEKSIVRARAANYFNVDIQHISQERLNKYFTKSNGQYYVNEIIRNMCVFAVHNVLKNPPFSKIDLISCRNVLTYFNPFLQIKLCQLFIIHSKIMAFYFWENQKVLVALAIYLKV